MRKIKEVLRLYLESHMLIRRIAASAYSNEIVHSFRSKSSTCSGPKNPVVPKGPG